MSTTTDATEPHVSTHDGRTYFSFRRPCALEGVGKRVIAYVSSDCADDTVVQLRMIQELTKTGPGTEPDEVLCDIGGGPLLERPGIRAVLQAVSTGQIEAVVVADLTQVGTPAEAEMLRMRCLPMWIPIRNLSERPGAERFRNFERNAMESGYQEGRAEMIKASWPEITERHAADD